MPVVEHEVHPHGVRDVDHRYSCFDRPDQFEPVVWMPDGWNLDGTRRMASLRFRMSNECRYNRSETDPACKGCKHIGSGAEYIRTQEQGGAK